MRKVKLSVTLIAEVEIPDSVNEMDELLMLELNRLMDDPVGRHVGVEDVLVYEEIPFV